MELRILAHSTANNDIIAVRFLRKRKIPFKRVELNSFHERKTKDHSNDSRKLINFLMILYI